MKNNKDYWKDEVMKSIDGLKQAEPNTVLWNRLENRIKNETFQIIMVSKPKVWAAAASIFFLLGINIFILLQNNHSYKNKSQVLVEAYQLNNQAEIQLP